MLNKKDMKIYRQKNKDIIAIQRKDYYQKHKREIQIYGEKYRKEHKEELKQYELENKTKIAKRKKKYYQKHKEKLKEKNKQWQDKNKARTKRYRHNIINRLLHNCDNRITRVLKNIKRVASIKKLIGCSREDLKSHIGKQFKQGMTWKNYNRKGWVIDHIRPCCTFDLRIPEEQYKCFNYKNLQPLWDYEHIAKAISEIK